MGQYDDYLDDEDRILNYDEAVRRLRQIDQLGFALPPVKEKNMGVEILKMSLSSMDEEIERLRLTVDKLQNEINECLSMMNQTILDANSLQAAIDKLENNSET